MPYCHMDNKQNNEVNKIIESNIPETPETPKTLEQKRHLYYFIITF